ncbi:MAG: hypothetical protein HY257_06755 [Chloroflexi bacterium]|nr:hypothetical protein [Chloroflexota bacterium]
MNLKPCPFRIVDLDGHILCEKIKRGDREVSPNICRVCPISAINCAHLRATLDHHTRPAITVRYGNGRTEVWDDLAPSIALERAACSAKVIPITSPRDCAGCPLRQSLPLDSIPIPNLSNRRISQGHEQRIYAAPSRIPIPAPAPNIPNESIQDAPRKSLVAQKIEQLQEWLAKQKTPLPDARANEEPAMSMTAGIGRNIFPVRGEEKRAGWTD